MRINRYLARAGIASRRKAEEYVKKGRVWVNGEILRDLATEIREGDEVVVDDRKVVLSQKITYLFHKPRGYLCSRSDPHGGRLIYDLLPKDSSLFSVGRLDKDSEGLLFVTNDGEFAEFISHPSHQTEKEYLVVLDRPLNRKDQVSLQQGITYQGQHYRVDHIEQATSDGDWSRILADWPPNEPLSQRYRIVLHEGKKREIRMLFQAKGYRVRRLIRIRIGSIFLQNLRPGEYQEWRSSWRDVNRK